MIKSLIIHLFLSSVLIFILTVITSSNGFTEEGAFPLDSVVLYGNGTSGSYSLGKDFIGGTVFADTTLTDYKKPSIISSDSRTGSIIFDRSIETGDSVRILFSPAPSWLIKKQLSSVSTSGLKIPKRYEKEKNSDNMPLSLPGLTFGGSKTFDISTGSGREASLNQTLRLNISGNITEDIVLRASISDQNTPLSPEGDTKELDEIDRVMIELEGKSFKIDMGDTDLKNDMGRWLSYQRRLSGMNAVVKKGNFVVFGSGANSEGRRMSIRLSPVEGNQGPYRLTAENGRADVSIIPGTEKLWINGEALTRGSGNDYTIDYTTGEIIFTDRRIIGSDMRIVCDYEYSSESFLRNFYSAGAKADLLDSTLTVGFVTAREADNSSKPVFDDIDAETKKALALSGDSPAVVSGIKPADGDSVGTYDLNGGFLIYNAAGKGKYKATFSWVGDDKGSYRYLGGGIYEYVPSENRIPGAGTSYEPLSIIQGPVAHNLAGLTMAYHPKEWINLNTEVAGSSVDLNTLSSIGDGDNSGGARSVSFRINPGLNKSGIPVKLDFYGSHRSQGRTFSPLDRDRPAEENRKWGLPVISVQSEEKITEFSGGVFVDDGKYYGSGIGMDGGTADFGDTTSSKLTGLSGILRIKDSGETKLMINKIEKNNNHLNIGDNIERINFSSNWETKYLKPSLNYESEKTETDGTLLTGNSYQDIMTQLKTSEFSGISGSAEWFYRLEKAKNITWRDSSTVRGGAVELSTGNESSNMFRFKYGKRERTTGTELVSSDQASMDVFFRPSGKPLKLDLSYRAGRTREASKRKNYIYAGTGRGNYRWEDINGDDVRDQDEFIPDIHGEYYLYEETLSDYKPLNAVTLFGKSVIDISPNFLRKISGGKGKVVFETAFEINEKSKASASDVFLLDLSKFRKNGITSSGDSRIQQDITVPVSEGNGSLRLRYFRFDRLNSEYVTGSERNDEEEYSLRLRLPLREDADSEVNLKKKQYKRVMDGRSSGDYDVDSYFGDAGISIYPSSKIKAGINTGVGNDKDKPTGIGAVYYSMKPSLSYQFGGKGKIEANYTLTSVKLNNFGSGMRLQYTMAQGQKEGKNHEIEVTWDYRLTTRMNIIATYTGRQFGGEKFETYAQAQVRAIF